VLDDANRVLLVCHGAYGAAIWVTPGGGVEENESDAECLRRELLEETGLASFELGEHVWSRTAYMPLGDGRWDGESERIYLVRTQAFVPAPAQPWEALRAEGMTAVRWWTMSELEAAETRFAPRRLPLLLRELILHGPPGKPVEVGL
jgi:8-oxo-dGTP pyrophosphatase MutT (NUDIX family)